MGLRRPNDLISDEELSFHERACIGFVLIGAIVTFLLTDAIGLFFGAGLGFLAFHVVVAIATAISSFLSRRRR